MQPAPFCVTVSVCPAIVRLPTRCPTAVFAATVTATVPLPLPDPPDVTVIHGVPLTAVHPHPVPAVTATVSDSPAAGELRIPGEMVGEHVPLAPACVTVNG